MTGSGGQTESPDDHGVRSRVGPSRRESPSDGASSPSESTSEQSDAEAEEAAREARENAGLCV